MNDVAALEASLRTAVAWMDMGNTDGAPSALSEALRYALFPAGARLRPRLTLHVARAFGAEAAALPAAVALELIHNASLVHDDMACFDDAATRRGKPSVQRQFGQPMALLVGDALLALGSRVAGQLPSPTVRDAIAEAACLLILGQAQELGDTPDLARYHAHKTACMFAVAAEAGAVMAGQPAAPYAALGGAIGRSYQLADDLFDAGAPQPDDGKSRGRDAHGHKPNVAHRLGSAEAEVAFLQSLADIRQHADALPAGHDELLRFVDGLMTRFCNLALPRHGNASMHASG